MAQPAFSLGLNKAEIFAKSARFEHEGTFNVVIDRVVFKTSQQKRNEEYFIVEFHVDGEYPEVKNLRYGWVVALSGQMAPSNIKGFLAACLDIDPRDADAVAASDTDWDAAAAEAVGPKNPFEGTELALQTNSITTKKGEPFLAFTWLPRDAA